MNNENKKLKDLINKSLDENPIPYDDKYWLAAEKLLDKEKRKSGWMFFMVPATVIVALSGAYLLWDNNTPSNISNKNIIANEQVEIAIPATEEAAITSTKIEDETKVENNTSVATKSNMPIVDQSNKVFVQEKNIDDYSINQKSVRENADNIENDKIEKNLQPITEKETTLSSTQNDEAKDLSVLSPEPLNSDKETQTSTLGNATVPTIDDKAIVEKTNPDADINATINNNSNLPDNTNNQISDEKNFNDSIAQIENNNVPEIKKIEVTENPTNEVSQTDSTVGNDIKSDSTITENIAIAENVTPPVTMENQDQIIKTDGAEKIAEQTKEIEPAAPIEVKIEKQKRAKQFSLGLLAGAGLTPAITSQIGNKYNYLSYKAGLNLDYTIGKVGISTGANYHIKNGYNYSLVTFKKGYSFGTSNIRTEYLPTQSRYLEIPLMLHYKTGRHLVGVGGAFECMLQTKLKVENHGTQTTTTEVGNYDFMHQYDIGLMVQYQYTINANFSIGVNLFQGSVDAVNNEKSSVTKKDINRFIEPILIYKLIKR